MEINAFLDLFLKVSAKYGIENIDIDEDGTISEKEILYLLASEDEELCAELSIEDLNTLNEITGLNVGKVQETENVESTEEIKNAESVGKTEAAQQVVKRERKPMAEYIDIINNKYDELWEKFSGNSDEVIQYVKNNLKEFADIDGDGAISPIDNLIFRHWLSEKKANSLYSEKGEKYTETLLGSTDKSFKRILSAFYNHGCDSYRMNLDDLEYYYQNLDNYNMGNNGAARLDSVPSINIGMTSNINYAQIAQSENWEERLNKLFQIIPAFKNNEKGRNGIIEYVKNISDHMNKNSQNGVYAVMAIMYKNNASPNTVANQFDYDGDGVISATDLGYLSADVDLDGDGIVSTEEKDFICKVKKCLEKKVYQYTKLDGYYNINNIENVISYYENVDTSEKYERMNLYIANKKKSAEQNVTILNNKYGSNIALEDYTVFGTEGLPASSEILGLYTPELAENGYMDGTGGTKNFYNIVQHGNIYEVIDAWETAMTMSEPYNTYFHYIKNADLSKEKLEEILHKINSAPSSVQIKLTDVKQFIEQKLLDM